MTGVTTWAGQNQRRLAGELARVRGYLEQPAASAAAVVEPLPGRAGVPATDLEEPSIPGGSSVLSPSPAALDELCALFTLSPFERDILLLCAGVELDARFAPLVADVQRAAGRQWPTFGLALARLPDAHWAALAPDAPLRRWRLVELLSGEITTAPLRIDERILHFLAGTPTCDERLRPILRATPEGEALGSHAREVGALARLLERSSASDCPQLTGADVDTRLLIAAAACRTAGAMPLVIEAGDIPAAAADRFALAQLVTREMLLSGGLLIVDAGAEPDAPRVARFVEDVSTPVVLLADQAVMTLRGRTTTVIEVALRTASDRTALLRETLGPLDATTQRAVQQVTTQFDLSHAAMRRVASAVRRDAQVGMVGFVAAEVPIGEGESGDTADSRAAALWDAARAASRPRLDALAQRLTSTAGWDDLVLPDAQRQTLETIVRDVRQRHRVYQDWGFAAQSGRGLGITALFSGPSGTGKTLAAEVLGNALRLDVYRIDLAAVVSKYIGETEKNLARLFATAEGSGAVLLFDEADALFGKRSEVRDSHDRYANIEVSYLLQRMESYQGLAILTSNQRAALDPAFTRRIRYIVNFPFPDRDARAEIWRRSFPAATPTEPLDYVRLAQLNLAGGHIRNVALGSAFLAAERDEPVRMSDIAAAARAEYAKLERPLADAEMRGW